MTNKNRSRTPRRRILTLDWIGRMQAAYKGVLYICPRCFRGGPLMSWTPPAALIQPGYRYFRCRECSRTYKYDLKGLRRSKSALAAYHRGQLAEKLFRKWCGRNRFCYLNCRHVVQTLTRMHRGGDPGYWNKMEEVLAFVTRRNMRYIKEFLRKRTVGTTGGVLGMADYFILKIGKPNIQHFVEVKAHAKLRLLEVQRATAKFFSRRGIPTFRWEPASPARMVKLAALILTVSLNAWSTTYPVCTEARVMSFTNEEAIRVLGLTPRENCAYSLEYMRPLQKLAPHEYLMTSYQDGGVVYLRTRRELTENEVISGFALYTGRHAYTSTRGFDQSVYGFKAIDPADTYVPLKH